MAKLKFARKHPVAVGLMLIVIGTGILALWPYAVTNILGSKPDYQEYVPADLPSGVSVTPHTEFWILWKSPIWPSYYQHTNVGLSLSHSSIEEEKDGGYYSTWCGEIDQRDQDCASSVTPKGQHYLLAQSPDIYPGKVKYEAYFIKGKTAIDFTLNNYSSLAKPNIATIIDSFVPGKFVHNDVRREAYGSV